MSSPLHERGRRAEVLHVHVLCVAERQFLAHLGRLLAGLTRAKRWLVIICADHGDASAKTAATDVASPTRR
ncbi:hypothetical protein [Streptomyces sp. NPDC054958]